MKSMRHSGKFWKKVSGWTLKKRFDILESMLIPYCQKIDEKINTTLISVLWIWGYVRETTASNKVLKQEEKGLALRSLPPAKLQLGCLPLF